MGDLVTAPTENEHPGPTEPPEEELCPKCGWFVADNATVCCHDECPGPTWELHSLDPLHVEPSVKTTSHHGFIRDGKWVPA